MPRSSKRKAAPTGVAASVDYVHSIREGLFGGEEELPAMGWEPNPCYLCSPNFMAREKGTGRIQTDTGEVIDCPACTGPVRPAELVGYGPQARALVRKEYEILYGGQKGGGKSACLTAWMVSGNPDEPEFLPDGTQVPVNQSYTYHPNFRGLVLRRNLKDLNAWISEATQVYAKLGGEYISGEFRFPSGAVIWTGHLEDETSYEKYQGIPELHRVGIEEACQIPSLELYMQIVSCVRSKTDGLRPQLFLTANPIGPGLGWVGDRFVKVLDENGKRLPPETRIVQKIKNPFTGVEKELDRVFISAGLRENPFLLADEQYVLNLAQQPEKLRKAYLEGDWDVLAGVYFDEFRAYGPAANEPDNANHVIGPRNTEARIVEKGQRVEPWKCYPEIKDWWPRSIGGDVGYTHHTSFHVAARDPDTERIHVYKEIVFQKTGYETIGVQLGRELYSELTRMPSHSMTLWLARDAFAHRGDDFGVKSIVELIIRGLRQVLGEDAVYCPDVEIKQRREREGLPEAGMPLDLDKDFRDQFEKWEEDMRNISRSGLRIMKCNSNRILGWSYMRDVLNWQAPPVPSGGEFDYGVYQKLFMDYSVEKAMEYLKLSQPSKVTYPMLQVWETCPRVIEAIPKAIHDPKNPEDVDKTHFEGMDELDSLRYLLLGLDEGAGVEEPFGEWKEKSIRAWEQAHPDADANDRRFLHDWLADEEKRRNGGEPISVTRSARSRGQRMRRAWRQAVHGRVQ